MFSLILTLVLLSALLTVILHAFVSAELLSSTQNGLIFFIWFLTSQSRIFQFCWVFLGWTSTKLGLMCLAQGRNTAVMLVRLEPTALRSRVKHSTTEPLCSLTQSGYLKCHAWSWSGLKKSVSVCNGHQQKFRIIIGPDKDSLCT